MKAGSFEKKDFCFNLRFPGQYYDSETEFYYNFHRYYMPEVGRYLREDPAGGSGNYFYVNSNPVSFMDYSGLIPSNSDFHCWIVCDWADIPKWLGMALRFLHCWLEWGSDDPPIEGSNSSWGMYPDREHCCYDRVGNKHGDREGIIPYELSEDCCCKIFKDPPKSDENSHMYIIGNGTCNTVLQDYLRKVCPKVGYGPPPIPVRFGLMVGWRGLLGSAWKELRNRLRQDRIIVGWGY